MPRVAASYRRAASYLTVHEVFPRGFFGPRESRRRIRMSKGTRSGAGGLACHRNTPRGPSLAGGAVLAAAVAGFQY